MHVWIHLQMIKKHRILAVMANSPRRNTLNASTACQAPAPIIGYSNLTGSINEGTNCSYTDVTFPITIAKAPSQNAMVTFSVNWRNSNSKRRLYNC